MLTLRFCVSGNYNINSHGFIFRQLRVIGEVQDALNSYYVVTSVLDHLSRPQDDVVREVLAFLAALLFNGNENVQVWCFSYCYIFFRETSRANVSFCQYMTFIFSEATDGLFKIFICQSINISATFWSFLSLKPFSKNTWPS